MKGNHRHSPHTTAIRRALRMEFTALLIWPSGWEEGMRNAGEGGMDADPSRGRNVVIARDTGGVDKGVRVRVRGEVGPC